jgi:hypothetical protein
LRLKRWYIGLAKAMSATGGASSRFVPVAAALLGPSGTPWPHRNGSEAAQALQAPRTTDRTPWSRLVETRDGTAISASAARPRELSKMALAPHQISTCGRPPTPRPLAHAVCPCARPRGLLPKVSYNGRPMRRARGDHCARRAPWLQAESAGEPRLRVFVASGTSGTKTRAGGARRGETEGR